jgi:hypothetical protein
MKLLTRGLCLLSIITISNAALAYGDEEADIQGESAEIQSDMDSEMELASAESDIDATVSGGVSTETYEAEPGMLEKFRMNYFGIFYGPSVQRPSSYQPDTTGRPDVDKPVIFKNFLNLGYQISDTVAVTGTAFWIWQPVLEKQMTMEDPFVRVSHNSIWGTDRFNLYGDFRVHFPVTRVSRENDMKFGLQSVQVLTYSVGDSGNLTLGTFGSVRVNSFGGYGFGRDMELYIAPNINYQVSKKVALTLLYEIQTSHAFGARPFAFTNDGMDIEPGVSWDVTQNVMVNPYLHFPVGANASLRSTSIGMMLNWALI